jgi:hypothetical protein
MPIPDECAGRSAPPGVTIAIANWNHELLLPRSVKSALVAARALRDGAVAADVLVIDDGSRDGSRALLLQLEALYFDGGLRARFLPDRRGVGAVRNAALGMGTYRHLVFLDADNELVAENLPLFYRAALDTRAAAVYGNMLARLSDGMTLISNESAHELLFERSHIDMCAMFDRLQVVDAGGFDETPELAEDYELYLHLVAGGRRLVFVPAVFGVYHQYPGSRNERARGPDARVFNQLGVRGRMHLNGARLRYHPDVGYL